MEKITRLADWMREAKSTVILTGAGMLTESGARFSLGKGLIKQSGAIV
ncbi:MAG: hypothetical protein RR588_13915 [Solibacillus sp.]